MTTKSCYKEKKFPQATRTAKKLLPILPELLDEAAVSWKDHPFNGKTDSWTFLSGLLGHEGVWYSLHVPNGTSGVFPLVIHTSMPTNLMEQQASPVTQGCPHSWSSELQRLGSDSIHSRIGVVPLWLGSGGPICFKGEFTVPAAVINLQSGHIPRCGCACPE